MNPFIEHTKVGTTSIRDYVPGENMHTISISPADLNDGHPVLGDKVAQSKIRATDMWLISKRDFDATYVPVEL
tara:strand:- start:80295 stop:80513 length:219 start_codon:yes stop_codon:yes gene_type:complete